MRARGAWVRERVVLLTYKGSWGTCCQAIVGDERDVFRATECLRGHATISHLADAFRERLQRMRSVVVNLLHWAFSIETCPETLASGEGLRLHIHLCMSAGTTG